MKPAFIPTEPHEKSPQTRPTKPLLPRTFSTVGAGLLYVPPKQNPIIPQQ